MQAKEGNEGMRERNARFIVSRKAIVRDPGADSEAAEYFRLRVSGF